MFTKRTPELPRASCRCSHGPVGRLPSVKRSAEGTGLQHCKIALFQSFAIMRFPQVKHGANGNDATRINLSVRHVVVALNVIETDRVGDAWLLI